MAEHRQVQPTQQSATRRPAPTETLDIEHFNRYIDIGFCVLSIDNVTNLLIKMLGRSIHDSNNQKFELKRLIAEWEKPQQKIGENQLAARRIRVPYASRWSNIWDVVSEGAALDDDENMNILIDVFGVAFHNFLDKTHHQDLDKQLASSITDAFKRFGEETKLHRLTAIQKQRGNIVRFLQISDVARDAFLRALIEETIRTAEWTPSELNSSVKTFGAELQTVNQHQGSGEDETNAIRSKYYRVSAMIEIRNKVIHKHRRFADREQEKSYVNDYERFVNDVDLLNYYPLSEPTAEKRRLMKPVDSYERMKTLGVDYKALIDKLGKEEEENKKLRERVSELEKTVSLKDRENLLLVNTNASLRLELEVIKCERVE